MSKIGIMSWLVSGLSLVIVVVSRSILGGWIDMLWVPLALFLITFAAGMIADYKFFVEFLTMKTTKKGMNMGIVIVLSLILLVSVNFLAVKNNKIFDLTEEKLFSLSPQSIQVLNQIKNQTVSVKVFYRGNNQNDLSLKKQFADMLTLYKAQTSSLNSHFYNAYVHSSEASKYLNKNDGFTVLVEKKDIKIRVKDPFGEEQLTNALVKDLKKDKKTIYFVTGHGERSITSKEDGGIEAFVSELKESHYNVKEINLFEGDSIPPGAELVVIVGPQRAFFDGEIKQLRTYLAEGGSLFLALDPGFSHGLAQLTRTMGVEYKNNFVINDRVGILGLGAASVVAAAYDASSEITKKFRGIFSMFHIASSVKAALDAPKNFKFYELVQSHNSSYAVNDLSKAKSATERKVHTIGVSVKGKIASLTKGGKVKETNSTKDFHAVVFGDSDFLTNKDLAQGLNRDLAMNIISYLAKDTDMISIRPKKPKGHKLILTSSNQTIVVLLGLFIPLALFILSGLFWYRRRGA